MKIRLLIKGIMNLRFSKSILLIVLVFLYQLNIAFAQSKITLNESNATLQSVITKIGKQSGFDVIINGTLLKIANPITINCTNVSLEEAMKRLLSNQPLAYHIEEKTVVIVKKTNTSQPTQNKKAKISGLVQNVQNTPLADVNVTESGTTNTTVTNKSGEFDLNLINPAATLIFTSIGFERKDSVLHSKKL
ncbi:secretin and TonB N-terminal domain-containing protein [Pedobacter sp. MW01-1-1]|uniref:secretin and TonB N-terminal domain-containing protein n=1 Tax=Pedobacter sp. MW01-1-1 TaxID=3383027 RepID=UPI003FF1529C